MTIITVSTTIKCSSGSEQFIFIKVHSLLSQVNVGAINSTILDYCYDAHTPLAMAWFPITSPPVARAYEAGTAARAVAAATVALPVVVRCNGVSCTRE